jgi:hypothetical protein
MQWPKENGQKDKQWSIKHYTENLRLIYTNPTKTPWWTHVSCSTSGTLRVTLITKPMIRHAWGKNQILITTNTTYPWSFVRQIFCKGHDTTCIIHHCCLIYIADIYHSDNFKKKMDIFVIILISWIRFIKLKQNTETD